MRRPITRQWVVLWLGVVWTLLTLLLAEEYAVRGVFAALIVTALLFWQLAPSGRTTPPEIDTVAHLGPRLPIETESQVQTSPSAPVHLGSTQAEVSGTSPEPRGVGGWLGFVVLSLGIFTPLACIAVIMSSASDADSEVEFLFVLVVLVLFASFSVYSAIALFRRWPNAPRIASRFILISGVLSVLAIAAASAGDVQETAALPSQILGGVAGTWAWTAYLSKSRRVKNTYSISDPSPPRTATRLLVVSFATLLVLFGFAFHKRELQRIETEFAAIDPYQWAKVASTADVRFREGYSNGVLQRIREENGDYNVSAKGLVKLDDLSHAVRVSVEYTMRSKGDGGTKLVVDGATRNYFHSTGLVTLETACLASSIDCSGLGPLVTQAEEAMLVKLNDSGLTGILPVGECSTELVPGPRGSTRESLTCSYAADNAALLGLGAPLRK